jgi:hypothetical protein
MFDVLRARLRRRRGRLAVIGAIAVLGATVAMAHSSVADSHMGEAAAMCLAILAGGVAVAALPRLRDQPPFRRADLEPVRPATPVALCLSAPPLPRGDPAVLQVFRR